MLSNDAAELGAASLPPFDHLHEGIPGQVQHLDVGKGIARDWANKAGIREDEIFSPNCPIVANPAIESHQALGQDVEDLTSPSKPPKH